MQTNFILLILPLSFATRITIHFLASCMLYNFKGEKSYTLNNSKWLEEQGLSKTFHIKQIAALVILLDCEAVEHFLLQ